MFGQTKPTTIAYLARNTMFFYDRKKQGTKLELPLEAVKNLELIDPLKLSELISDALNKANMSKQRVLLVLDNSVVFSKSVGLEPAADSTATAQDFLAKIPFSTEDRALVLVKQADKLEFHGANGALLKAVTGSLTQAGNKVVGVVPAAAYGKTESEKLSKSRFDHFFSDSSVLKKANFLTKN